MQRHDGDDDLALRAACPPVVSDTSTASARPGNRAATDETPADGDAPSEIEADVAILGAGSAAEILAAALSDSPLSVVVFEPSLVGGQCPFVACMPSKSMLHDAAVGRRWDTAVARRSDVVDHLDDGRHASSLQKDGATLVRSAARFVDPTCVEAGGRRYRVRHIVIATGADSVVPPIEGLAELDDAVWTSADAMRSEERPTRLAVIGGGVIGCEMAQLFAGFGTEVHLLDVAARAFPDLYPQVGEIVDDALRARGVKICRGTTVEAASRRGGNVRLELSNGSSVMTDRVLVATGTRPRLDGLRLDRIGVHVDDRLPVDDSGRVAAPGSIWAIGDVAGRGEYTHLAKHQAQVVANHLDGDGSRRFDDVVLPACVFVEPPVMTVGPTRGQLEGDDDVVWATGELSEIPRWSTDELIGGFLAVAARRSTGCLVAAHGAGARFDELVHALVVAIDGQVPVRRLAMSMQPFPTVGEVLGPIYRRLLTQLD